MSAESDHNRDDRPTQRLDVSSPPADHSTEEPDSQPTTLSLRNADGLPERLGEYLLQEKIAEGGMGIVYRATQESLRRDVALKIMRPHYACDPDFVSRFNREATSAAALDHPNIVKIYSIGMQDGVHYFAMEYIPGINLKEHLQRVRRLDLSDTLDIIIRVADALDSAHEHAIIHRDIKPENIMLCEKNRVKVTDFGLAKSLVEMTDLTEAGKILGTANYMAPEQGLGGELDTRSDIYSLGAVFFELLTGRPVFRGDNATTIVYMHVHEPAPPVTFYNRKAPEDVSALIARMLAKDAAERPQNPRALLTELEHLRDRYCRPSSEESSEVSGASASAARLAAANPVPPMTGYRALIVDADTSRLEFSRKVLSDMGFQVDLVRQPEEIFTVWSDIQPHFVLLDLDFFGTGNVAALAERDYRNLKGEIIAASSSKAPETIREAAAHQIRGYLLKPFTAACLQESILKRCTFHR